MLLGPIVDAPIEEWDRMVALNVHGLLYVAHAALPHLLAAAEGGPRRVADLVNISSVAGRRAGRARGVYQLDQARRRRLQRVAAPGGHQAPRARLARRAGRRRAPSSPSHIRDGDPRARSCEQFGDMERLQSDDIADAIVYVVTRDRGTSRSTRS